MDLGDFRKSRNLLSPQRNLPWILGQPQIKKPTFVTMLFRNHSPLSPPSEVSSSVAVLAQGLGRQSAADFGTHPPPNTQNQEVS